ncbi:MAG: GAF domain-containing hybrid sensor histidine kinase/response regulator [Desulfobulbaceae bacterium]
MTEYYNENRPLYGSRGIDIYLKLVRRKYPQVDIARLLEYAEMKPYQVKDEGHLFSQRQINRFYEKLVELTGNKNIAREAGRFASSPEALGTMRRSLLGLISPAKYYELIGTYANKISKASRYEAKRLGPNRVEIVVTPLEGTKEEPYQCQNRMGYWDAVSLIYNLKPPKIEHPECLFEGGKSCRYIVSWQKTPVTVLKAVRNFGMVFLVLACVFVPPFLHYLWPTLSPWKIFALLSTLSVSLLLIFNWYLKNLEVNHLLNVIDSLGSSADDLMDQVEINYENSLLINEIGQTLAKESEIEGIFSELINIMHRRLDYDRVLVMLATSDRSQLLFQAGSGYSRDQIDILEKISFQLDRPESKGIFAVVFREQKPQLINDIAEIKNDLSPRSYEFARQMEVKSLICCPIIYEKESLGILAVDNLLNKRPLLERDVNLLMGIALQIGSRIHNVKLESHIRQIQKMEAVGNLAGGVAHDFNNMLTTILGYSQILTMKLPQDDPLWKMADAIHHAGLKASGLTQQLLAFSRKQVMEMKATNLNIIVEDMTKMLSRLIGEDIIMKTILSANIRNIMADASQIGQVLMNLVVNARDAMPGGGRLTIETADILIDERYATQRGYCKSGHYSMLSVTDTGKGMSPELREKIFEPFFTTKGPGKGTGLGLSTVYGIVKQHNGSIHVHSEPDHGTCFKIYLPVVSGEVDQRDPSENISMAGGTETILVVDDDEAIRNMILDTLQPLGYTILTASCATEALDLSKSTRQHIDLVLSDVIMPGMNGRQLVDAIRVEQPTSKGILMSGYSDNVLARHGVLQEGYFLINKPLLPISLANKIRKVLDQPRTKPASTAVSEPM